MYQLHIGPAGNFSTPETYDNKQSLIDALAAIFSFSFSTVHLQGPGRSLSLDLTCDQETGCYRLTDEQLQVAQDLI